jgi:hypothetical protein
VEPEPTPEPAEQADIAEPSDTTSQRRFSIYQLKNSDELHDIQFEPYGYLQQNGIPCDIQNYDLMYSGNMRPHETLENLFYKFNTEHPKDFRGHSLSVSDVVVVRERGKSTAYYVDSVGFKQLDHFEKSHERTRESREARDFER